MGRELEGSHAAAQPRVNQSSNRVPGGGGGGRSAAQAAWCVLGEAAAAAGPAGHVDAPTERRAPG